MEGGLNVQEYEVIFYDKADGTEPAKDFILSLDKKMRAKMLRTISLLADNGPDLREPCSKPLGDGIFELRAKVLFHSRPTGDPYQRIYQENTEDTAC
mgnify:CR=1 FL=1